MYEQRQKPQNTASPPLQMKTDDSFGTAKKSKSRNPYEGAPIQVSGALANRIRDGFGIQASELKLRESPQVAEMGARATAQGDAIRFAPGEFRPDTSEGMAVLGHELSHIREQAAGNVRANVPGSDIHYDAGHEAASDRAGEAFASGGLGAAEPVSLGGSSAYGAPVQGDGKGIGKWFRNLFGRGDSAPAGGTASGGEGWATNPLFEGDDAFLDNPPLTGPAPAAAEPAPAPLGAAEAAPEAAPAPVAAAEPEAATVMGEAREDSIPGLLARLRSKTKLRGDDSAGYQNVAAAAESVNTAVGAIVTRENFVEKRDSAITAYQALLHPCEEYLTTHAGRHWTPTGRARVAIIKRLAEIAASDLRALYILNNYTGATAPEQYIGMTLSATIIREARTEKINLSGDGIEKVGAGSSTRLKFQHNGRTVFFTEEETLFQKDEAFQRAIESIPDKSLKAKMRGLISSCTGEYDLMYFQSPTWLTSALPGGRAELKGKANCTRTFLREVLRNVEQYFGTDDSSLEQLFDICVAISKAYNGAKNFSEMGGIAVGEKLSSRNAAMTRLADLLGIGSLLARSVSAEVTKDGKKLRGNLMEKASGEGLEDIGQEGLRGANVSSGELQRQLVCLQVLDSICGQVDRNRGNYFFSSHRDEHGGRTFTSLQGIDNDMAFGNVTDLARNNSQLPPLLGADGRSSLPMIDADLAERVRQITPDMVLYAVGDVITNPAERDALVERVTKVKATVENLRQRHDGGEMTLLGRGDWDSGTQRKLMEGQRNYYQQFVEHVRSISGDSAIGTPAPTAAPAAAPAAVPAAAPAPAPAVVPGDVRHLPPRRPGLRSLPTPRIML